MSHVNGENMKELAMAKVQGESKKGESIYS
jgi:hypothetical protein